MKKQIFSISIILCLVFSLSVPVLAAENTVISDIDIKNELDSAVNERINAVADQFEGFPDSYMRVYKQIVYAQEEAAICDKYGLDKLNSSIQPYKNTTYSLSNGGIVYYSVYEAISGDTFDVAVTCLERQRTLDFILNSLSSFTIGDLGIAILGYVPYIGPACASLSNITSIVNASIANKIKAAGGYTQITNIAIRVGNQPGTNGMSTVEGWTTHTKYTTPSNASNEKVTFFPAYNG